MIPFVFAAIGGYLIGDATRKKFNPLDNPYNILARGGQIEYGVRVSGFDPENGNIYSNVYDIEANSDSEAMEKATIKFTEETGLVGMAKIMNAEEIYFDYGGETPKFKFTFKTDNDYHNARGSGYIDTYDIVRVEVQREGGGSVDFPVHSEEELHKLLEEYKQKGIKINKIYPAQHAYDIQDYYEPEDEDEYYDDDYAKGGKVKFRDKSESIADKLEGTKVPARLRKDYGARYNRKEAEEAGRRIAGAQLKKLKEKPKK